MMMEIDTIKYTLQEAIDAKRYAEIHYTKPNGQDSVRVIGDIKYKPAPTHIKAFCCLRQEYRTFKICRISFIRILSTEEEKQYPSVFMYKFKISAIFIVCITILGGLIYLFPGFFLGIAKFVGWFIVIIVILLLMSR